jgi:hypothetical protein
MKGCDTPAYTATYNQLIYGSATLGGRELVEGVQRAPSRSGPLRRTFCGQEWG